MNPPVDVFVYGSLKQGQSLYFLEPLVELRLQVRPAIVRGARLYDLGPFPALVFQANGGTVRGELHRFCGPTPVLEILDELEDYRGEGDPRNLYRRIRARAELGRGQLVPCWVYEYVGPLAGAWPLPEGLWEGTSLRV